MSNQIAILRDGGIDLEHTRETADVIGRGGLFNAKNPEEIMTKMMAGASLGIDPVQSVMGIDIIQGKVSLSAALVAAAIDSHPRYSIQFLRMDKKCCDIAFYSGEIGPQGSPFVGSWSPERKPWDGLKPGVNFRGVESFSIDDAKQAGLLGSQNWKKYPRAMLRARAITEGQKAFAPSLGGGIKAYTPEELGGDPHEDDLPASAQASTTYIEAEYEVEDSAVECGEDRPGPNYTPDPDLDEGTPTAQELREPVMVAEQEMLF